MGHMYAGVDQEMTLADSQAKKAANGAGNDAAGAAHTLAHADNLLGVLAGDQQKQLQDVMLALKTEQMNGDSSVTEVSDERMRLMQELGVVLDEAKSLAGGVFTKRLDKVGTLDHDMDNSLENLSANGKSELAKMIKDTVSFSKNMGSAMKDMETNMAQNAKTQEGAKASAAQIQASFTE